MGLFKICYCCILFVYAPYNNMKIAVYNIFINFKSSNKGIFYLGKHNGISLGIFSKCPLKSNMAYKVDRV